MLRIVGLLSGTSADGIDAALCEVNGAPPHITARILRARSVPYDRALRSRVLDAMRAGHAGADTLCALNFALGEAFAQAALDVLNGERADLIGSHGQTLWHQVERDGRVSATLQLGEPAVITERTGITTIGNFRTRDVAAGGQGAPLMGYLDWLLLRHPHEWRAVQNIGGIGNVTFLPPLAMPDAPLIAFDTGPGNALLDAATELLTHGRAQYDVDGRMALAGTLDADWLAELLRHPFYHQPPPKTTGRELFSVDYAASLIAAGWARKLRDEDVMATLTALTAGSIVAAYRDFAPGPIAECILSGGGRRNQTLVGMLRAGFAAASPTRVTQTEDHGIDGDFKEGLLFALLAHETWHNRPGCLPSQTGAAHASVLGQITPGSNYAALLRETW